MRLNLPRLAVGGVLDGLGRWLSHCLELLAQVRVVLDLVLRGLVGVPGR